MKINRLYFYFFFIFRKIIHNNSSVYIALYIKFREKIRQKRCRINIKLAFSISNKSMDAAYMIAFMRKAKSLKIGIDSIKEVIICLLVTAHWRRKEKLILVFAEKIRKFIYTFICSCQNSKSKQPTPIPYKNFIRI